VTSQYEFSFSSTRVPNTAWCDTNSFVSLLYFEKVIQPVVLPAVPYPGVRRWQR
jgi:hypothetical protein